MRLRLPNGLEADGEPSELADFVATLQERIANGPLSLPAPTAEPAPPTPPPPEPQTAEEHEPPARRRRKAPPPTKTLPESKRKRHWKQGNVGDFLCPKCDRHFPNRHGLGTHRRRAHGLPYADTVEFRTARPRAERAEVPEQPAAPSPPEPRPIPAAEVVKPPPPHLRDASPRADKTRITVDRVVDAVSAYYRGLSMRDWAGGCGFRGNIDLVLTIVTEVGLHADKVRWMGLSQERREALVMRALGDKREVES